MIENSALPKYFLERAGVELPSPTEECQHIFISDLHIDPNDVRHIPLLKAIFAAFPNDITIFGGDNINIVVPDINIPGISPVLPVFAELARETQDRTVVLRGNHDPKLIYDTLINFGHEIPIVPFYSYAHSTFNDDKDHRIIYTHGDDRNLLTSIGGFPLVRKITSPIARKVDTKIHQSPLQGRTITLLNSLLQRSVFKKILPPNTTAVVGHTHFAACVDLDNNRHLITSGCGYEDSLNGRDGVFKFNLIKIAGKTFTFQAYQYNEVTQQVEFLYEYDPNSNGKRV